MKDEGEGEAQVSSHQLKLEVEELQQRKKMFLLGYQFWLKIVAVFLFFGAGAWLYSSQFSTQELLFLTKGTVQADTLTDGSVIVLNKHSLLRYPEKFRGGQRQVWLTKGEAFFTVAPVQEKSFVMHISSTTIKVAGASFNVKNRKGSIEIIVEKGTVQVNKGGQMNTLNAGEKVLIKQNSSQLIKVNNTDQLYTYYRTGGFNADGVPLWKMVEVLNEVYNSHIIIGRKGLKNRLLTGTIKNVSLEAVLAAISRNTGCAVKTKNNQVILY
jgi:transmembrane sensor